MSLARIILSLFMLVGASPTLVSAQTREAPRTVDAIVSAQLGNLMLQNAVLSADNEAMKAQLKTPPAIYDLLAQWIERKHLSDEQTQLALQDPAFEAWYKMRPHHKP